MLRLTNPEAVREGVTLYMGNTTAHVQNVLGPMAHSIVYVGTNQIIGYPLFIPKLVKISAFYTNPNPANIIKAVTLTGDKVELYFNNDLTAGRETRQLILSNHFPMACIPNPGDPFVYFNVGGELVSVEHDGGLRIVKRTKILI